MFDVIHFICLYWASMSQFLKTLMDVLNGESKIQALPNDKLIALNVHGESVAGDLTGEQLLKLARLQTLRVNEISAIEESPSFDEVSEMAKQAGVSFVEIEVKNMCIRADTPDRIVMLDRLIVEVVRDIFPKEVDVFDVLYSITPTAQIIRREKPRPPFD